VSRQYTEQALQDARRDLPDADIVEPAAASWAA
jgi:hypothetical protein